MRRASSKLIVVAGFAGLQPLDAVGPLEVFATAGRLAVSHRGGAAPYRLRLLGAKRGPLPTASGYALHASSSWRSERGPLDTLILPGGAGVHEALRDEAYIAWIRRTARHARRVAAVCTGAFLLAEAGLLADKRATTHWASCERLAQAYPRVRVERDPIFVSDGRIHTSAGVTAGIDLSLALVEADLGHEIALETARWLVVFLKRPGGQAQFSALLSAQTDETDALERVRTHIAENPSGPLDVPALARHAAMSPRNFARRFVRAVGETPARYVERVRVETARRRLESTDWGLEEIALRSGFGTTETMRRAFFRALGVAPSAYRSRFAS